VLHGDKCNPRIVILWQGGQPSYEPGNIMIIPVSHQMPQDMMDKCLAGHLDSRGWSGKDIDIQPAIQAGRSVSADLSSRPSGSMPCGWKMIGLHPSLWHTELPTAVNLVMMFSARPMLNQMGGKKGKAPVQT